MDVRMDGDEGGASHDAEPLLVSDHEEYQDTDKLCTNLLEEDHITMEQTPATNIYGYPTPNDELYVLNDEENSYTGMNKEESRKAASARVKYIQIVAYFIAKVILIYREILVVCSSSVTLTDRLNNHFYIIVGPQGPASEQYIDISLVQKDTLCDICTLQKEEELHSLLVYWYFLIVNLKQFCECRMDKRKFDNIVHILGYCVTPLMMHTLDKIYELHRIDKTESFEDFLKRITPLIGRNFNRYFNNSDKRKINLYTKFDITLINKSIDICVEFCNLSAPPDVSIDNNKIKSICKEIKDLRNEHFHNLPGPDIIVVNNYSNIFDKLQFLVKDLKYLINKQFHTPYPDDKYMKLNFLTKIPFYSTDYLVIVTFIIIIIPLTATVVKTK